MGHKSLYPAIGEVLGTGVTCAVFQTRGIVCTEKLTNLATIGPSSGAQVLNSQKGICSGQAAQVM